MRIAFFSTQEGWGGSEVLWAKTAIEALEQGHEVFLSVKSFDVPEEFNVKLKGKAKIKIRPTYNSKLSFLKKLSVWVLNRTASQYNALLKFKPDHVVVNQSGSFDMPVHYYDFYLKLLQENIPYTLICHSHEQFSSIPRGNIYPRGKDVFRDARQVYFVSEYQRLLLSRSLCIELPNSRLTWNPLNLSDFSTVPYPHSDTPVFALVGFLGGSKGFDTILEVLSSEVWRKRDWLLNLYGDGYGKTYLEDLLNYYRLGDKVIFKGYQRDVREIWAENQILLVPSSSEGLPISLCEAMLCGRTAVVTDVGGHSEIIFDEENGFISSSPAVKYYSQALERAWERKADWSSLGLEARSSLLKKIDLNPHLSVLNHLGD